MSERKINLDDYVDDLPLGVASYRNKIKIVLKDFAKELLELAAENAETEKEILPECGVLKSVGVVNKQSILDTINQVEQ